jgi:hypothetical protein
MQFVASLVRSLAWPLVVASIAIAFRMTISNVVSERLKHLKVGPVEIDLEKVDQLRASVEQEQGGLEPVQASPDLALRADTLSLVEASPPGAFVSEYIELERLLRRALGDANVKNMGQLGRLARERGLFSLDDLDAFEYVRNVRNQVVHGIEPISAGQATELISLIESLERTVALRELAQKRQETNER